MTRKDTDLSRGPAPILGGGDGGQNQPGRRKERNQPFFPPDCHDSPLKSLHAATLDEESIVLTPLMMST